MDVFQRKTLRKAANVLLLALVLSGCGQKSDGDAKKESVTQATETEKATEVTTTAPEEETLSPEQMDLVKYNYYVELNNDILDILDDIDYYFEVVDYAEEFALLPDTGDRYLSTPLFAD